MKKPTFTKVINLSNNINHICRESNKRLDKLLTKQKALSKGKKVRAWDSAGNRLDATCTPKQYLQHIG